MLGAEAQEQAIRVNIGGRFVQIPAYDQPPVIVGDRTLVPLRAVMEALGFDVDWIDQDRTALLDKPGYSMSVQIGTPSIRVNGGAMPLDVPAQIINGRTMVPVRAISEATGAIVFWDTNTRIVHIFAAG
jgi:hypothetical protein